MWSFDRPVCVLMHTDSAGHSVSAADLAGDAVSGPT